MTDHERIEELMAARALGGLDPGDEEELRRVRAAHGPECAECRRLESELAEVAGRLAFALDPEPVRPALEDRVVAAATGERPRLRTPGVAPREPRRSRWLRPLVAVAASIVLFAAGLGVGALTGGDGAIPAGARVVAFEGDAGGRLSVAFPPDGDGLYLLGSDLEAPPAGSVYEVWMFRGQTPVPATCFRPTDEGSVFSFIDADLEGARLMAVTVEPNSCPSAPTTDPILLAEITA
jgi:hypothetical protein